MKMDYRCVWGSVGIDTKVKSSNVILFPPTIKPNLRPLNNLPQAAQNLTHTPKNEAKPKAPLTNAHSVDEEVHKRPVGNTEGQENPEV
jgi:hypothetical protein